jgi:hypothetical protein
VGPVSTCSARVHVGSTHRCFEGATSWPENPRPSFRRVLSLPQRLQRLFRHLSNNPGQGRRSRSHKTPGRAGVRLTRVKAAGILTPSKSSRILGEVLGNSALASSDRLVSGQAGRSSQHMPRSLHCEHKCRVRGICSRFFDGRDQQLRNYGVGSHDLPTDSELIRPRNRMRRSCRSGHVRSPGPQSLRPA